MATLIAMPLWLLVALVLFALIGFWLAVAAPLLADIFYRRRQRAVRKLDEKLEFGLSQYALAQRSQWLDRLLSDVEVARAMQAAAQTSGESIEKIRARARRISREIVPLFNLTLYFRLGYWLARWLLRLLYRIEVVFTDKEALAGLPRDVCVVQVSNHRSNIDPFLLIYLGSDRTAISYSAGEWARPQPLRYLLHSIGFYLVRRRGGGDPLYRVLLRRYVYLAASHCVPQGLFLEGELSRDGNMQPLKLGLLSYILRAYGNNNCRDIVFVPVGMSYERIPEDRTLVRHGLAGFADKAWYYPILALLRFLVLVMPRMVGLGKPFGKAAVVYGRPVFLSQWLAAHGRTLHGVDSAGARDTIDMLADGLAQHISQLIPVLPVALLSQVLLGADGTPVAELQLKHDAWALARFLRAQSVNVVMAKNNEEQALSEGLMLLLKRGLVAVGSDGCYRIAGGAESLLAYYRNAIPTGLRTGSDVNDARPGQARPDSDHDRHNPA